MTLFGFAGLIAIDVSLCEPHSWLASTLLPNAGTVISPLLLEQSGGAPLVTARYLSYHDAPSKFFRLPAATGAAPAINARAAVAATRTNLFIRSPLRQRGRADRAYQIEYRRSTSRDREPGAAGRRHEDDRGEAGRRKVDLCVDLGVTCAGRRNRRGRNVGDRRGSGRDRLAADDCLELGDRVRALEIRRDRGTPCEHEPFDLDMDPPVRPQVGL